MTSSIATILFTDVVDSTALMQRLGDERAQRVFERAGRLRGGACGLRAGRRPRGAAHRTAPAARVRAGRALGDVQRPRRRAAEPPGRWAVA
jgi:hypothetical protein